MSDVRVPPLPEAQVRPDEQSRISDLSYRNYDGPLKPRFVRWWIVAKAGLQLTWGQWWFYLIALLPLFRFLLAGFLMFLRTQLGAPQQTFVDEPEGQRFALQFWSVLCGDTNSLFLLVIALTAGAGCISADNRANALLVYLSKPIGRIDYILGKWMSIFLTLLSVALVPTALLYLFALISYRDDGFLKTEPWLGPRLLIAVTVPAVIHASLIVGISAWSKSARIVSAIYTSVYILGGVLASICGGILYKDKPEIQNVIQHLSLRGLIIGIDQNVLHVVVPIIRLSRFAPQETVDIPKLWPLLTMAGVLVIGSLAAAWIKIRAVEVVRG
ncbi:MAG TPA: ABC transporter permease subunit [Chthonomonadaceae bacterium]|nr:ABC transporter permease subunit [Chthonomonadaceae bacterium]